MGNRPAQKGESEIYTAAITIAEIFGLIAVIYIDAQSQSWDGATVELLLAGSIAGTEVTAAIIKSRMK